MNRGEHEPIYRSEWQVVLARSSGEAKAKVNPRGRRRWMAKEKHYELVEVSTELICKDSHRWYIVASVWRELDQVVSQRMDSVKQSAKRNEPTDLHKLREYGIGADDYRAGKTQCPYKKGNRKLAWWAGFLDARSKDRLGHIFAKYKV